METKSEIQLGNCAQSLEILAIARGETSAAGKTAEILDLLRPWGLRLLPLPGVTVYKDKQASREYFDREEELYIVSAPSGAKAFISVFQTGKVRSLRFEFK